MYGKRELIYFVHLGMAYVLHSLCFFSVKNNMVWTLHASIFELSDSSDNKISLRSLTDIFSREVNSVGEGVV